MKRVLLDTNLLIAALDEQGTTSVEKREKATRDLSELLEADDVALVITPLIRYEVLRGVSWKQQDRYQQLQQALNGFEELDISCEVSELAANLYRYDRTKADAANETRNFEKRKFDIFHLASAKCNALELISEDSDFVKLLGLYEQYMQEANDVML